MLFISGNRNARDGHSPDCSFNLVIEMLFISGRLAHRHLAVCLLFQSRHREAFHFREELDDYLITTDDLFQSRNREAFHFR